MIKKALKEITIISDDEDDNLENYLDALNYLDNIYKLVINLQQDITMNDFIFLPSFKGRYISQRLGIPSTADENELKDFRIQSSLFLEKKDLVRNIKNHCKSICSDIIIRDNIIQFILK